MDLEKLISQTYDKYKTQFEAEEEKAKASKQQQVIQAIAGLQQKLDEVISPELQKTLGIQVFYDEIIPYGDAVARFSYRGVEFAIRYGPYRGGEWDVIKAESDHDERIVDPIPSGLLVDSILYNLGEIREQKSAIDPSKVKEIQETLNTCYVAVEKIAQSEVWRQLCELPNADPEMKTHLGDVLHYLSEAMECLEG